MNNADSMIGKTLERIWKEWTILKRSQRTSNYLWVVWSCRWKIRIKTNSRQWRPCSRIRIVDCRIWTVEIRFTFERNQRSRTMSSTIHQGISEDSVIQKMSEQLQNTFRESRIRICFFYLFWNKNTIIY